uniref:Caldesmon 1 n=1 Tax=Ornithorhynchus anatinus TaxID=9258 RepID=A0A6I8NKM6_ORNAN
MQGNILKCRGAGRGMNKGSKSERCRRVLKERKRGLSQGRPLGGDVPSISVADEEAKTAPSPSTTDGGDDAAFLERLARREERRQKRLQEALERQKEFDPTVTDDGLSVPSGRQANDTGKDEAAGDEDKAETRRARYEIQETETVTKSYQRNEWRETQDGQREKDKEEEEQQQEEEEEKPKQRILEGNQGEERGIKVETKREKAQEDRPAFRKEEITAEKTNKDQGPREDIKSSWDRKKGFPETKSQNGERVQEFTTHRLKHTESTFSRGKAGADTEEAESQVEAGRRLEELRRRRGETESEEFEKLKQKQQEAAVELEELKKKREERRKVLEEEEHRRKQEEAERKIREEEEKRRLKEEIERRRAEAAEKRQKMPEDGVSDDKKPFKCFTPKGSSLKVTFFTHYSVIHKHLYTIIVIFISTLQGTKTTKSTKPAASDLPVPAEGVRNIKSMWEKGNVFASPTGTGSSNKVSAGGSWVFASTKWLTKTPEGNKSPAPKPSDLRPVDVSNKRNLWEKQSSEKTTSPMKVDLFHPRSSYWALLPLPICPVAPGMVDKELGGWEGGENEPLPMWSWVSQRRP